MTEEGKTVKRREFLSSVRPDVTHGARVVFAMCQACGTIQGFRNEPTGKFPDTGYWTECRACAEWRLFFRIHDGRVVNEAKWIPPVNTPEGGKQAEREINVERIAVYIESESRCLMPIVVEETKHDYGVRLLKVMAGEIRQKFAASTPEAAALSEDRWCVPGDMKPMFLLRFDDIDRREMVFDNEKEARAAWAKYSPAWNCWLFGPLSLSGEQDQRGRHG